MMSKVIQSIPAGKIYQVDVEFEAPHQPGHYYVVLQHQY